MRHASYRRACSLIVLGLLTSLLLITQAPATAIQTILQPSAIAQFTPPQLSPTPAQPPPEVTQIGGVEVAPVKFQGETLFNVVSPAVLDRKNPGNRLPVEVRAKRIEQNLQYIIAVRFASLFDGLITTTYDPKTLSISTLR